MGPGRIGSRSRNLLNPLFDHESCGVGFVATLHAASNHHILRLALTALGRLAHRGAVAVDRKSSDGVGILTGVPRAFLLKQTAISLPAEQPLAVGMLFMPREDAAADLDSQRFQECIASQGLQWLAWRHVPIRREVLGQLALSSLPVIRQALVTVPEAGKWAEAEIEHRLYLARKAFERQPTDSYVCSLSSRTIVYKALCAGRSLHDFYPDLGATGRNFGAGMTGGTAYVWDHDGSFRTEQKFHAEFVETKSLGNCDCEEQASVRELLERHVLKTGSRLGQQLIEDWPQTLQQMLHVAPKVEPAT